MPSVDSSNAVLKALQASATPSPKLVLTAAKRLRTEVLKISAGTAFAKRIPNYYATRDNLSLYTRLVRIQTAAYHQSVAASSTAGPKDPFKDMNEDFKFVPPTGGVPPTGSVPPDTSTAWTYQQFGGRPEGMKSEGSSHQSSNHSTNHQQFPTYSREQPFPVYIVPSTLAWLSWGISAAILIAIIFMWTNNSSEGGGAFSGLLGNRFEIAEPGDLSFDDVKGNAEAKEELFDVVEYLKDPTAYAALGIKIPKGILLTGPPGTGKTMLARVVAAESGVPFISTSGAEFEEMLVGVGARRVRQLFQLAKKHAPCIVFIDEIDAVGSKRDDDHNSHRMSINQLLVEMDGFNPNQGIVVIGATNLSEILDPALIRPGRFDRKVVMELPDPRARRDILDHYLKNKTLASDVATAVLARAASGFSGADLETMVNWASIISSKKKSPIITMRMLEEAMLNVAMGRERKSLVLNEFTRKLCAYHEGGHALVSLKTPGSMDIRRATLVPRGHALGMVNFLTKEDSPLTTRQELLAQMDIGMGGRAAEHLIYGEEQITQGAGADFQQATEVAESMVTRLGMSPRIGPVSISTKRVSTETMHIIEQETQRLCRESYDRAYNLLQTHEKELHLLAAALLKYESLTSDEIKRVIAGDPLDEKDAELELSRSLDQKLAEEAATARAKRREEIQKKRILQQQDDAKHKKSSSADEGVKVTITKND